MKFFDSSFCKCFTAEPTVGARAVAVAPAGKVLIPTNFTVQPDEQGTPQPKLTPKRGNSVEGRWKPEPEPLPKPLMSPPRRNSNAEPPTPDSARAKALMFEEKIAAAKPPAPAKKGWWPYGSSSSTPSQKSKAKSKQADTSSRFNFWSSKPATGKPATATKQQPGRTPLPANPGTPAKSTVEADGDLASPGAKRVVDFDAAETPVKNNKYGPPSGPAPLSAKEKAAQFESKGKAPEPAPPKKKGWVSENGKYKKNKDGTMPPKKEMSDLP